MAKRIEVKAGSNDDGGFDLIEEHDSLKAARARVKYLRSDAYARQACMSYTFRFVGIYVGNELVEDFWAH